MNKDKLIELQKEYIEFLGKYIRDTSAYLHVHGQCCSKEIADEGIRLRAEILKAETNE